MLASAAGINWLIDPDRLYRDHKADDAAGVKAFVAALISSSHGLLWSGEVHAVKLEMARVTRADCVVMGSSRAFYFDAESLDPLGLNCSAVVNLSVGGQGLEDFLTLLSGVLDNQAIKHIVVTIDPWLLRRNVTERWPASPQWQAHAYEHSAARKRFGLSQDVYPRGLSFAAMRNLVNADYTLRTLQIAISQRLREDTTLYPIRLAQDDRADPKFYIIRPDGTLTRPSHGALPDDDKLAGAYTFNTDRVLETVPDRDAAAVKDIASAIAVMRAHGKEFVFIIQPYHPAVRAACPPSEFCAALDRAESDIRALARSSGIAVVLGGLGPFSGLGPEDFMDSVHLTQNGTRRFIALIRAREISK